MHLWYNLHSHHCLASDCPTISIYARNVCMYIYVGPLSCSSIPCPVLNVESSFAIALYLIHICPVILSNFFGWTLKMTSDEWDFLEYNTQNKLCYMWGSILPSFPETLMFYTCYDLLFHLSCTCTIVHFQNFHWWIFLSFCLSRPNWSQPVWQLYHQQNLNWEEIYWGVR